MRNALMIARFPRVLFGRHAFLFSRRWRVNEIEERWVPLLKTPVAAAIGGAVCVC
jgi:hypothetical protein